MIQPLRNPFVPTFGASPPLLAGRSDVLSRVETALRHGPTHPDYTLLLTGPRGSGKTAVLNALENIGKEKGWAVISVTASSGRVRQELLALLSDLSEAGGHRLRLTSVHLFGLGGSVERDEVPSAVQPPSLRLMLDDAAGQLASKDRGLLLTIDELQAGDREELREFTTALQHVTRRSLKPLAFVGAALPEVEDTVLADPGMTFFQRCARARLGSLSAEDTRLGLERPILESGGLIQAEALDVAVESAGGYPFMVQLVGFHSWDICDDPSLGISRRHVEAGVVEAYAVLVDQIVRPVWNGLSDVDKDFLLAMSEDESHSRVADLAKRLDRDGNYVNYYRGRLLRAGAVLGAGRGKLRFAHPAMRNWLRTRTDIKGYGRLR